MCSTTELGEPIPCDQRKGELSQGKCALIEEQVLHVCARVCGYMQGQREHYLSIGKPLDSRPVEVMGPFFSPKLLAAAKVVQLVGQRITEPSFGQEIRALGLHGLVQVTHIASMTFEDVLVFNDKITDRLLFHALVRSVQFQVLGLDRYVELFVRAFVDTRLRFRVPLEGHAFELESKFAADREAPFSVEDEVRMWVSQHRYELF